jgi:hypothetical protein
MKSLEQLSMGGMSAEAQQHASTALLALGAVTAGRKQTPVSGGGEESKPPPHIMMSYNWDHQEVILRVVAWLQAHGYLVWVDTEQMKGATVDTMALAVESSVLLLLGMSRQYKESSNCRMEAQYALQKKKPLIPLKLVQGYEADGWLGLMLGTAMWYGFYGETLSSDSAFGDRMDALSREIGSRGRVGAAVPAESTTVGLEPEPWTDDGNSETEAALVEELRGLKLLTLRARALDASIASDIVDDATDSDDPKSALIALLVMHAGASAGSAATAAAGGGGGAGSPPKDDQPTGGGKHRRAELEGMGVMALHKLAVSGGIDVMSDLKDAMGE